jgi:hypothetical protein
VKCEKPTLQQAMEFRQHLIEEAKLKPSSVNVYTTCIKSFHKMQKEEIKLPFMKVLNKINFYFTEEEISRLFSED